MTRAAGDTTEDTFRSLPAGARRYIAATAVVAVAAVAVATAAGWGPSAGAGVVVLLAVLCAAGNAFQALAPGRYSLQPNYAFFIWGALLLPPWAIAVLAAACFAPERLLRRTATYKSAFNIVNYVIAGLVVALVAGPSGVAESPAGIGPAGLVEIVLAAAAGAVVNHLLIVVVIALAGEMPLRATLPQLADGLPMSVGMGLTGAVLAALWGVDPLLVVLACGPLALVYRALWVPMLRHQADTDAKTGLFHSERLREELASLLVEAERRGSRLAVAMIDLDHLRTINGRCGHLAGDRAIRAVADELAAVAARHGIAARFGGEEFSLLLPGFEASAAKAELDDVRRRLRSVHFREEGAEDLYVSFSAGVSVFPDHGRTVDALVAAADAALYEAKAAGRDRVRIALSAGSRQALAMALPLPEPPAADHAAPLIADQPLPAAVRGRLLGRMLPARRAGDRPVDRADPVQLRAELDDTRALLARMQESYVGTITTMARAAEEKDPYRQGSIDRVAAIAGRLAAGLGMGSDDLAAVRLAAALRDIGTVGIRESVLLKGGDLDPLERQEVRRHTDLASRLVADLELPITVKQMVRSHHERFDGGGYPDGLAGEDIPLAARVLAVADALDAMLSPRPYRPPLAADEARARIVAAAGTQFCPRVVAALERTIAAEPGWIATVAEHPSKTGQDVRAKDDHDHSRMREPAQRG